MKTQIKMNVLEQRFFICLFAFIVSFFGCVAWRGNIYDLLTIYIIVAICLDQFSRFVKPTPIKKKELLTQHKVTLEQLGKYVQSKRDYRLFAAGLASLAGGVSFILGAHFSTFFTITCALVWSFYPLYRITHLKIPVPRIKLKHQKVALDYDPLKSMYDEHNPMSSAWHAAESRRIHNMMDSLNSLNSHSKNLH
ncbi:hypothetical protein IM40_07945 [Candidatus Paracaedimonas acanthamoebae]|nr:hypothetical protein IM40_07945 [Candidatus Paracaedimonas acanthamoebae]